MLKTKDVRRDYNDFRPHSSLGTLPLAEFAEKHFEKEEIFTLYYRI
jgi:transposase InsO family protein